MDYDSECGYQCCEHEWIGWHLFWKQNLSEPCVHAGFSSNLADCGCSSDEQQHMHGNIAPVLRFNHISHHRKTHEHGKEKCYPADINSMDRVGTPQSNGNS